jgi:hypothetical protein
MANSIATATPPSAPLTSGEVLFAVSVDTEEDNWIPARDGVRVENARELPRVNALFERLGLRPTYFVTHSLAVDPVASRIIAELNSMESVEIGAHLHPWNTPPLDETFVPRHTMLANIPAALQRAKLERLTIELQSCLDGERPRSFRAGRWGFAAETIGALLDCGYTVDSSVTPYTSWQQYDDGPSHIGAPVRTYRLDRGSDVRRPSGGPLVEVPPSFGFNRTPMKFWAGVQRVLETAPARALLLDRIAAKTGAVKHLTLSPEIDTVADMLKVTRALLAEGAQHLHFYFHSPSLKPGLSPYVRTKAQLEAFYAAIEEYVERASAIVRLRPATVSEIAAILEPGAAGDRPATRSSH